jgi:hypothetical protein
MIDLPTRLRAGAEILLEEAAEAAEEVERLRAEVALLKDDARKLYDIAASGAEWMRRRRMLDEMLMESFEEHG